MADCKNCTENCLMRGKENEPETEVVVMIREKGTNTVIREVVGNGVMALIIDDHDDGTFDSANLIHGVTPDSIPQLLEIISSNAAAAAAEQVTQIMKEDPAAGMKLMMGLVSMADKGIQEKLSSLPNIFGMGGR